MKKKLLTALSLMAVAAVSIVGTIAYLTSEDQDVNIMTMGNVAIEQHEYERVVDENGNWVQSEYEGYGYTADEMQKFTNHKPALPAVYQDENVKWDDRNGSQAASGTGSHQQPWSQIGAPGSNQLFDDSVKNVIDKFVFVENTGKTDAYYRTIIAVECPEGLPEGALHYNTNANSRFSWEELGYTEIDGVRYSLRVATYKEILKLGEVSRPSFLQLYLDPSLTNEDVALFGDTLDILVLSQAVQTQGFATADAALNEAFGEITLDAHPWSTANYAFEAPEMTENVLNLDKNYILEDEPLVNISDATEAYTVNGNGKTVTMKASAEQTFDWDATGTIPQFAIVFSSENGELVTVNDLTITGQMQSVMAGNYESLNQGRHNTVFNNVNIVDAEVVSLSAGISPALSVYGKLEMNNCNVYGSKLSALDTDPMWPVYDVAVVNESVTTVNGGKIGSIITWAKAKMELNDVTVDSITVNGNMNTNAKYGIYINDGTTVDTIDLSKITNKAKINITVADGATVNKVVANGVEYASIDAWKNAQ